MTLYGLCMQIGICSLQAKWIQVNLLKTTNLKLYPIYVIGSSLLHVTYRTAIITNCREWPCREPWIPLKCDKTADSWAQRTENCSRRGCTLRCNCHDGCTSSACCLSLSVMWLGIKIFTFKVRIQNSKYSQNSKYTGAVVEIAWNVFERMKFLPKLFSSNCCKLWWIFWFDWHRLHPT